MDNLLVTREHCCWSHDSWFFMNSHPDKCYLINEKDTGTQDGLIMERNQRSEIYLERFATAVPFHAFKDFLALTWVCFLCIEKNNCVLSNENWDFMIGQAIMYYSSSFSIKNKQPIDTYAYVLVYIHTDAHTHTRAHRYVKNGK